MKHLGCQLTPASKTNLPFDKSCFFLIFFPATPNSGQKSTSMDLYGKQSYTCNLSTLHHLHTHKQTANKKNTKKSLRSLITGCFPIVGLVPPCVLSLKHDPEARQKHFRAQQNDLLSRKFFIGIMPTGYAKKEVPHWKQMNKTSLGIFRSQRTSTF